METYIRSIFPDDNSNVAIIYAGCNALRNRKLSSEQITRKKFIYVANLVKGIRKNEFNIKLTVFLFHR